MGHVRTGIEVTPETITAAQVRVSGSNCTVLADATMQRRCGDPVITRDEAVALESLLFRRGFAIAPCVISAPSTALRSTTMDLPPLKSGAPIDQLARAEFARRNKIEASTFELSYWGLPATGPSLQVMAVGCDIATTDEAIDAFESAGIRVAGVDDPARAVGRVLAGVPTLATVRVGARLDSWGATVVVLHHSTLLYARSPAGLTLNKGSTGHPEAAHRLAAEIDACVAFARHRSRSHAPAAISILGSGAQSPIIMDMLSQRYGEAMTQPLIDGGQPIDATLATAIGLAMLEDIA